jgi:hypothetical protein
MSQARTQHKAGSKQRSTLIIFYKDNQINLGLQRVNEFRNSIEMSVTWVLVARIAHIFIKIFILFLVT